MFSCQNMQTCMRNQLLQSCHSSFICTCAGLTTGVTLFADAIELIEAVWAALNTQLCALQLQKRRRTGPAGLRSWSCTQLTGLVTFLTVGALSVITEERHEFLNINESDICT